MRRYTTPKLLQKSAGGIEKMGLEATKKISERISFAT